MAKQPWAQFNRMPHLKSFFGIVNKDGEWMDSAASISVAVHWCCMADGMTDLTHADEIVHVNQSTWNIVHCSMLEKMYEAGLIS